MGSTGLSFCGGEFFYMHRSRGRQYSRQLQHNLHYVVNKNQGAYVQNALGIRYVQGQFCVKIEFNRFCCGFFTFFVGKNRIVTLTYKLTFGINKKKGEGFGTFGQYFRVINHHLCTNKAFKIQ